jgi:hypothetical protein
MGVELYDRLRPILYHVYCIRIFEVCENDLLAIDYSRASVYVS